MRSSRTVLALGVLFAGVLALLLWRYDPWVFAGALSHPIVSVLVLGAAVIWLAITIGYSVQDPKRAVIFKEGRFDRLEPGGRMLLWPGTEVGTEISLAEQRVLGWPIVVYDQKGAEVSIIFALTWRIVPTSTRPTFREQRMLLAHNEERRRIVIAAVETALREIARCTTVDNLKGVLTDAKCVEALRQVVAAQLEEDALTLDRLHMLRFIPAEKKDEPVPFKHKRAVTEEHDVSGDGKGTVTVTVPGPGQKPITVTGEGAVTVHSSSKRTDEDTHGIRAIDEVVKSPPKPEANICCPTCDLPLDDPKAPVMIVRFCKNCGGKVTPCPSCGKQQGPCPSCGATAS